MNTTIEYVLINPELVETKNFYKNLKNYIKKYGNSYWKRLDYKNSLRFFDKIKIKTKYISTNHGPNRTIVASNDRYEYIETKKIVNLIGGDIRKNVISAYIPLLWRKFFLNIANNRDDIIKYRRRPFIKFDRLCREW